MPPDYEDQYDFFFTPGFIIFCLALAIFIYAAQWKIFVKAGQPGWATPSTFFFRRGGASTAPGSWTLVGVERGSGTQPGS